MIHLRKGFLDVTIRFILLFPGIFFPFIAIDCGFLDAPTNGSSSGDLTVFPNTKYFTCDLGFLMGGSSERACQANGTWSGTNTTCSGELKKCSYKDGYKYIIIR